MDEETERFPSLINYAIAIAIRPLKPTRMPILALPKSEPFASQCSEIASSAAAPASSRDGSDSSRT
jgi:hypothetical protein